MKKKSQKFEFKYGKDKINFSVPSHKLVEVVEPNSRNTKKEPGAIVEKSLNNPVDSPKLSEIVQQVGLNPSVTITIEDHTRPVPNETVLPILLERLSSYGVSKGNITILVATGLHQDLTGKELKDLREIIGQAPKLINHHANNADELHQLGQIHYYQDAKKQLSVNQELNSADVTILTGDVEFHQLFGYGGGVKSILPGVADAESIRFNHSLMDLPEAKAGNLNNPLRDAAEEAAKLVGVDFSINLVLNPEKELLFCYSGDVRNSFRSAIKKVDEMYKIPYQEKAELVIIEAGGYPKDINLYQAQKALENGLELVQKGGDVVLIAKCSGGWGSTIFHEWVQEVDDLSQVVEKIQDKFVIGGHKAYIYSKEKEQANLHLISDLKEGPDLRKIFTKITIKNMKRKIKKVDTVSILKMGSSTIPVKVSC